MKKYFLSAIFTALLLSFTSSLLNAKEITFTNKLMSKDDLLGKTLKKYNEKYDFITCGDFRNAPKPLHNYAYEWPKKGIKLEYWAYLKINDTGKGFDYYSQIIKEFLLEIGANQQRVEKTLNEFKGKEEYEYFDYYSRVVRMRKFNSYIKLEIYLDEE